MKEARESNDSDKRVELYKKADYILSREDYGTIPLYYGKLQFVAKPYVKNAKLGNLIYHLYNIDIDLSDWDWIAEIVRWFMWIIFVVGLLALTNKLIGRG